MRITIRAAFVATILMLIVGGATAGATHLRAHSARPPADSSPLTRVEATKTVAAFDVDSVTVTCPAGEAVVSGGFQSLGAGSHVFVSDSFGAPDSWTAGLDNFDDELDGTITAVALCDPARRVATAKAASARARSRVAAAVAARRASHAR